MRTPTMAPAVDIAAARAALAVVVPQVTALIRSIRDPLAPAIGVWNAGEVAVHLAHAWEALPALSRGELAAPLREPGELAPFTISLVRSDPCRDLEVTAARIDAAASAYLATRMPDDAPRQWMFAGTALPPSAFACHLLNESLVHGYDIARSQGRRWRIQQAHAGMAIMGFLFPVLSMVDPRFALDRRHAAGVRARVEIRVRRTGRVVLVLDDGALTVEPPSRRSVDCHVSAEPVALFLRIWSRTAPWPALLTGRLAMWGRRPSIGMRLPRMLRNP